MFLRLLPATGAIDPRNGKIAPVAALACALIAASSSAVAQIQEEAVHSGSILVGVGTAPDYLGSDAYTVVPVIGASYSGPWFDLDTEGTGVRLDVLSPWTDGRFEAGFALNYRGGREDVDDPVVDRLPDVDPAIEIGGFVGANFPGLVRQGDALSLRLETLVDVADGHGGYVITPTVGYSVPVTNRLRAGVSLSVPFASEDFQSTNFGVSPTGSAATGLAVHDPDGGFYATNLGATVSYGVTDRIALVGIASYTRLIGDASDSSIVEERGSPDQFFAGIGLSYRF